MNKNKKIILDRDRKIYLFLFVFLFLVEIFIALFIRDKIIRPYFGDVLVVVLLYFLVRIFVKKSSSAILWWIFAFAVFVEFLQYVKIVEILNLQSNKIVSTIVGTTFDIKDIICYFIGTIFVVFLEKVLDKWRE